jgi:hypothetical protein
MIWIATAAANDEAVIRSVASPVPPVCLGPASGLLRRPASAKLLLCSRTFRFWLPRSGPPRKAACCLGSRAHSLPRARDKRAEQEKRMYLNRITLIGFIGSDAEKNAANATNIAIFSLATKTSWKNDAGSWESRTEWHRCVAFGKLADFAGTLSKGAPCSRRGRTPQPRIPARTRRRHTEDHPHPANLGSPCRLRPEARSRRQTRNL